MAGRSAAAAAASVLGFLLPLMLLSRLEAFGAYQSPFETLVVYGTAWIVHLPVALGAAGIAAGTSYILRRNHWGIAVPAVTIAAGFLFSFWMGSRPWLEAVTHGSSPSPWLMAGLCILAAIVWGVRRPDIVTRALPLALALSALGFITAAVAVLVAIGAPGRLPAAPTPKSTRPDIIIITIDTFSNAHMSSMGYARSTTPKLDAIGRTGVQFSHLVASSNFTTPTINSMLTGVYPWRHGAFHLFGRPNERVAVGSLPAKLHALGYSLRAVTTNPIAGIYKNGYQPWFDSIVSRIPIISACSEALTHYLPYSCAATELGVVSQIVDRLNLPLSVLARWEPGRHFDARLSIAAANALLHQPRNGRPVMLWLHLMPPHDPYAPPAPYVGRFDPSPAMRRFDDVDLPYMFAWKHSGQHALFQARYDEALAAVDAEVGNFVADLERHGLLNNAVLIISADHGESFTADYGGHSGPKLHDALIRIPLIIKGAGLMRGLRIDQPVSQVDLAPTILDLAGGGSSIAGMEGRSLRPLLVGGALPANDTFSMAFQRSKRVGALAVGSLALTRGRWKFVHYWGQPNLPGYRDLTDALYNIDTDPSESRDVAGQYPDIARAMKATILQKRATMTSAAISR